MSAPGDRQTPWPSQSKSRATRREAIPPERVAQLKKGPPPRPGRLPGQGIPEALGRDPTEGVPKDLGVPADQGKIPGTDGQRPRGAPGQLDRGSPGQMDPWADNPWAPQGEVPEGWVPPPPPVDLEDGDTFYMNHPNLYSPEAATPARPVPLELPPETDEGGGDDRG
jgi:hypothetical protein